MMASLLPQPTPARAARILRELFGRIVAPVAFRLWDGREVRLSGDEALSTVVFKSPEVFLDLIRHPTPYHFAEAYVMGRLDFEGDMFAIMPIANQVEAMRVPLHQKARLLLSLWRA
jgi:hypothetical protein